MKRLTQLLSCAALALSCAALVLTVTAMATQAYAQSASGRALLAYKEGVTPEEENADRAACHQWAVAQSGFDPSAIFQAQQAGINTRTILRVTEQLDAAAGSSDPRWGSGGLANARGSADRRRLNELYESYLRAGALCLEGRGYTVAR